MKRLVQALKQARAEKEAREKAEKEAAENRQFGGLQKRNTVIFGLVDVHEDEKGKTRWVIMPDSRLKNVWEFISTM